MKLSERYPDQSIFDWHRRFDGSIEWRLTEKGISLKMADGQIASPRSAGEPVTARKVWTNYRSAIEKYAEQYGVPEELVVACIVTESSGKPGSVRQEPGYESDSKTPGRVSYGLMQMLLSTAKSVLTREHEGFVSYERLKTDLLVPDSAIRYGVSYIKWQASGATDRATRLDPPCVAAAYNAGGVYVQTGETNIFKMRCYPIGTSHHIMKFISFFNDFLSLEG